MKVFVEPEYLRSALEAPDGRLAPALERVFAEFQNYVWWEGPKDKLASVSVWEILDKVHTRSAELLGAHAGTLLDAREQEFQELARNIYGYPTFQTDRASAIDSLAPNGLKAHGRWNGRPYLLPDLAISVTILGYYLLGQGARSGTTISRLRANCICAINNYHQTLDSNILRRLRLKGLHCHYCDTLRDVIDRIQKFQADLREALPQVNDGVREVIEQFFGEDDTQIIVLGVLDNGFQAYTNLRQIDTYLPPLGQHRLLAPAMSRRCIAVPVVRKIFPSERWESEDFSPPIKEFILEAAEAIGTEEVSILFPRTPTLEEFEFLSRPSQPFGPGDAAYSQYDSESYAREHPEIPRLIGLGRVAAIRSQRLENLQTEIQGLNEHIMQALRGADVDQSRYAAIRPKDELFGLPETWTSLVQSIRSENAVGFVKRYKDFLCALGLSALVEQVESGSSNWSRPIETWIEAVTELRDALYDRDVEISLNLQPVLSLQPLHKRVLGLVEYILVPRLVSHGVGGKAASALWTNAFTGWEEEDTKTKKKTKKPGLMSAKMPANADKLATLETEGNWLLHAADHEASSRTSPIDLAALLDGIIKRMSSAGEVDGVSVNLQPATPQVHARQLTALADRNNHKAACLTLYLGKVVLMLRNAVEHGTDRVEPEGLRIDTTHYWEQGRNGKPILTWLTDTAKQVSWRSPASLPKKLPNAAKVFLLTPASLQRCLVLLSLVMHGAFNQLGIKTGTSAPDRS